MSTDPLIEVTNLYKTFPGSSESVVSDISFTLGTGEILAILGPNGAGKTTTIKMLLGLVTPSSGTATILDYDTTVSAEMRQAMQHVGVVLEGARNAYWPLSALDNLRYFGGLRGLSRQVIDERAKTLLITLGLAEHKNKRVRQFSRGMQQKVALANALIHEPQLLVLDEPTLGLDIEAAQQLETTIKQFVKRGRSVLLTTHVMGLAQRLADRVLVIDQGRRVAYDGMAALLNQFDTRNIVETKIEGLLSTDLQAQIIRQFPSLVVSPNKHSTILAWTEPEQRQVIELFAILDTAGRKVVSVTRREPSLEEVFLSLTRKGTIN